MQPGEAIVVEVHGEFGDITVLPRARYVRLVNLGPDGWRLDSSWDGVAWLKGDDSLLCRRISGIS